MTECKCDLRTKLVGDGCRYCNPQEYIDNLIESLEEKWTWVGLSDEEYAKLAEEFGPFPINEIEAKLRSKND